MYNHTPVDEVLQGARQDNLISIDPGESFSIGGFEIIGGYWFSEAKSTFGLLEDALIALAEDARTRKGGLSHLH